MINKPLKKSINTTEFQFSNNRLKVDAADGVAIVVKRNKNHIP
jgi:hypothetical protein